MQQGELLWLSETDCQAIFDETMHESGLDQTKTVVAGFNAGVTTHSCSSWEVVVLVKTTTGQTP